MRLLAILLTASVALAQSPAFEAATIRLTDPAANRNSSPATRLRDRVTYRNITVKTALARAFDVRPADQVVGPAWISSERFDIIAKAPDGSTPAQMLTMMQTLLIERLQLELHHETRELPVYTLTGGGAKMKPANGDLADGDSGISIANDRRAAVNMSMDIFSQYLGMTLRTPVINKTGLTGGFAFPWEMSSEELGGKADHPSIFTIVEELGLKLESKKLPFDVIVVDRGNKIPIEN